MRAGAQRRVRRPGAGRRRFQRASRAGQARRPAARRRLNVSRTFGPALSATRVSRYLAPLASATRLAIAVMISREPNKMEITLAVLKAERSERLTDLYRRLPSSYCAASPEPKNFSKVLLLTATPTNRPPMTKQTKATIAMSPALLSRRVSVISVSSGEGRCCVVADGQPGADRPSAKVVLRNRWTAVAGIVATVPALGFGVFAAVAVDFGGVNGDVPDRWIGASVMVTFASFFWHVAVRPSVVVEPWGLLVRNPVVLHRLPWTAITAVDMRPDGLITISTTARSVVPFTFSGSVLSAVVGAPGARKALHAIEQARGLARDVERPKEATRRFSIKMGPLLVGYAVVGAFALAAQHL